MSETRDIAVLGVGGVGSAVAFHAARRGASVLAVDSAAPGPGNEEAVSTAPWRGFRATYFRDARYVTLAARALTLWRELAELSGETLFDHTGALLIGPNDHRAVVGVEACGLSYGLAVERWSREELHERTALRAPPGHRAVFERDAGLLRANACNGAHLRLAEEAGAEVCAPAQVTRIERIDDGFRLHVEGDAIREPITARHLVIAAGAGSAALLEQGALAESALNLPITLERHPEQWFVPPDGRFDDVPPFNFITGPGPRSFHGHPNAAGRGLMLARHRGGAQMAAPIDRTSRTEDEAEVRAFAAECLPAIADAPMRGQRVHAYVNLPDGHFAVGASKADPRLVVATALCGHGYKFASALGLGVAELCLGAEVTVDLSLFDPGRFR